MHAKGKIISEGYYSNCLLEGIKAKLKHPFQIKIYIGLPYVRGGKLRSSHVMWDDGTNTYDFSDVNWSDDGTLWQYFWYKGYIREWPQGFGKRFLKTRNTAARKFFISKIQSAFKNLVDGYNLIYILELIVCGGLFIHCLL